MKAKEIVIKIYRLKNILMLSDHNLEIMMDNKKDEIIEKLFESFLQNYK